MTTTFKLAKGITIRYQGEGKPSLRGYRFIITRRSTKTSTVRCVLPGQSYEYIFGDTEVVVEANLDPIEIAAFDALIEDRERERAKARAIEEDRRMRQEREAAHYRQLNAKAWDEARLDVEERAEGRTMGSWRLATITLNAKGVWERMRRGEYEQRDRQYEVELYAERPWDVPEELQALVAPVVTMSWSSLGSKDLGLTTAYVRLMKEAVFQARVYQDRFDREACEAAYEYAHAQGTAEAVAHV